MEQKANIHRQQLAKITTSINIVHSFMIVFSITAIIGLYTWRKNFVKLPLQEFASETQKIAFYTGLWSFWISIVLSFILATISVSLFIYRNIQKRKANLVHDKTIKKPNIPLIIIGWLLPSLILVSFILEYIRLLLFYLHIL